MTNFSDLSNELIIEVWHYILDPEAVENFAVTCKTIYSLGRPFIYEHNELKAKYSSITHASEDTGNSPAETLKTLLLNPRAALYVRNVSINGWRRKWGDPSHSWWLRHEETYSEETMELFRQVTESSHFVDKRDVHEWIDEIEEGDEDAIHALIVMRLPYLRSFTLLSAGRGSFRLYDTIKRISESQDTEALSRLREVRLGRDDGSRFRQSFDAWVPIFSALPSVKAIFTGQWRLVNCRHQVPTTSRSSLYCGWPPLEARSII